MVTAREEGKTRKKEEVEIREGKRRKRENGVAIRQSNEKDKAGNLQADTEMRVTELTIRGLKRKAFRMKQSRRRQTEARWQREL